VADGRAPTKFTRISRTRRRTHEKCVVVKTPWPRERTHAGDVIAVSNAAATCKQFGDDDDNKCFNNNNNDNNVFTIGNDEAVTRSKNDNDIVM